MYLRNGLLCAFKVATSEWPSLFLGLARAIWEVWEGLENMRVHQYAHQHVDRIFLWANKERYVFLRSLMQRTIHWATLVRGREIQRRCWNRRSYDIKRICSWREKMFWAILTRDGDQNSCCWRCRLNKWFRWHAKDQSQYFTLRLQQIE